MTTPTPCDRTGCERRATHYLLFKVPPLGRPMIDAKKWIVRLSLCMDHAKGATIAEVIDSELADQARAAFQSPPADLARAALEARRLGDKVWTRSKGKKSA